ncbi:MAG: glycoside hydrolase family 3 C-terminal domain-containing protein [Clostridiales bacterium]|nr:glycoside hydrolase family 3 C-terminal domain-containing protein [Clostridiales bacterium]
MKQVWFDTALTFEKRTEALVKEMTLEEKVSQLCHESVSIERLGIQDYNWWNECLHGVARAGIATVFPQSIGMAASFNPELMFEVATAISDEARAKYHQADKKGDHGIHKGLTFWSPNVNIFRDPRWGRGHETYGEDPYLTSRMGVEFCKGLQGDDEKYLKVVATAKHFAVHSGPEADRHGFDAIANIKDMKETYLPAFEACVKEAGVYSIMGAYNRTNGEACCASKTLLQDLLREDWGFDGFVVSDCGAIKDIYHDHHLVDTPEEAAALAVKNGCEINCGHIYPHLIEAVEKGHITEDEIDIAIFRAMLARMKLGMFDPPKDVPYASIPFETNDCEKHHELSKKMAKESLVLLKNDGILPLDKSEVKTIAVIGPNADNKDSLLGNYYGTPSKSYTVFEGIRNMFPNEQVVFAPGCSLLASPETDSDQSPDWGFAEAKAVAESADVVILVLGMTAEIEGEESGATEEGGDKENITMAGVQEQLMEHITDIEKPTILVNMTGSCIDLRKSAQKTNAILQAWYPGQFGGLVIAEALFGEFSPSGRLPITFYNNMSEIPDFKDYSMDNRTYKFFGGNPMYPFGFGLSYGDVEYYGIKLKSASIKVGEEMTVEVTCINHGNMEIKEVIQLYIRDDNASSRTPKRKLIAFKKVDLPTEEEKTVKFTITPEDMELITDRGERIIEPGTFTVYIGGFQPDLRSMKLAGYDCLSAKYLVE